MAMTQGDIAIGVFQEPAQAHRAIEELRQAGYSDNEIGYLTRVRATEPDETTRGPMCAASATRAR